MEIDLDKFRTSPGSKVYSGRDRGDYVRGQLKIDKIDRQDSRVTVKIPADIFGLNQSFFLGMFAHSIAVLGEAKFRAKYSFEGPATALRTVEDGIEVCRHSGTALDTELAAG